MGVFLMERVGASHTIGAREAIEGDADSLPSG
jgi:hypothetical protein